MEHSEKTPKQIVAELDNYVIGQDQAKKAISIALRNRYRRMQLPEDMQEEITPKNLMMIGPTGVGKTEIARRLAKIVDAPFIKVEATKFTELKITKIPAAKKPSPITRVIAFNSPGALSQAIFFSLAVKAPVWRKIAIVKPASKNIRLIMP